MSGVQSPEQRMRELQRLQASIDAEVRRVASLMRASRQRRSRREVPPCGTESAYQRHRYRGEEKDAACLLAHSWHERDRKAGYAPDPLRHVSEVGDLERGQEAS